MKKLIKPGFFAVDSAADARRIEFDIKNEQFLECGAKADVVFLGDSITHYWDLNLYFNKNTLKINRGIGGDKTYHACLRFDADVLQLDPEYIIILLGVNDLFTTSPDVWWGNPGADVDAVIERIEESFRTMLEKCKNRKVFVCSVLPQSVRAPYNKEHIKPLVLRTNEVLKSLCKEYEAEYVDYYSALQKDDYMPEELAHDGVHPNGRCYKIMADMLKEKISIL